MAQDTSRRWLKFDYFILPLLLVLAFYVAFIPHSGYRYPVHLDEWIHMAGAKQIASNATAVGLMDPVSGEPYSDGRDYEVGYHLFWAVFHQVSGLPWVVIFRYFPGIILIFTVLAVYILARRQGFGWEAAFFTCLIPTTVGILGPAFMVPMAMALLFIPLTLFLAFNIRTVWTYVALVIFMTFLVTIHGPTAVILVIIVAPFLLIGLKGDFKHSAAVILALAVPFIISLPWTWHLIVHNGAAIFTQHDLKAYVDYPRLARIYGYPIIVLCLGGTFLLAMRGGRREYGLVLGLTSILIVLAIFYTTHYGIPVLYERGLIPMMLMAGIAAGACLMALRKLELPAVVTSRLKISPTVIGYTGWALCLAAIVLSLVICIPLRQSTPYYHMISNEDYEAFVWIEQNVVGDYELAVLDPWKATAFSAVTGKKTYTSIGEYPTDKDQAVYEFLQNGCMDTDFLRQHAISIVYSESGCYNGDLVEVRENVYLFPGLQDGQ